MLEVSVDPELCIGSGDCVRVLPATFYLDEDRGVSVATGDVMRSDLVSLIRAAEGCPTQAIRVVGDGEVLHDST